MEVLSLVNFDNQKRVQYLEKSFGSYYRNFPKTRHYVIDSSKSLNAQQEAYKKFGIECHHMPGANYATRLKFGINLIQSDYFLFFPDDFVWIMKYELERAVAQAREYGVHALKLGCRGMSWFSQKNPKPQSWHDGAKLISGETLVRHGDLYVSERRWIRDFHEQFSLGCGIMQTEFARSTIRKIPQSAKNPGHCEKWAYFFLLFKRYYTAYYKMQTPVFHFVDLSIEGDSPKNRERAVTNLLEENYELFNREFNSGL